MGEMSRVLDGPVQLHPSAPASFRARIKSNCSRMCIFETLEHPNASADCRHKRFYDSSGIEAQLRLIPTHRLRAGSILAELRVAALEEDSARAAFLQGL